MQKTKNILSSLATIFLFIRINVMHPTIAKRLCTPELDQASQTG